MSVSTFFAARRFSLGVIVLAVFSAVNGRAATVTVNVGTSGALMYSPASVSINAGDTVQWVWKSGGHSVTSGTPSAPTKQFDTSVQSAGFTFAQTFTSGGTVQYHCGPHGACCQMVGSITVATAGTPTPTPTATATATPGLVANVSTRLPVGMDDNVLIEGFIVQGPAGSTKKIMVRALGPSLTSFGIADALANPTLEIYDSKSVKVATNDNWKTTQLGGFVTSDQSAEIAGSGLAPGNDLESAIIANLAPASYTAVVRGIGNTVGTGVVDAYDLSGSSPARLANIATRGLIQGGDKLMIAGFIIQNGPVKAVIRAIGPSLTAFGITNALADPTLQLRDQNGVIVSENDNWKVRPDGTSQQQELENTGLQPTNDLESALFATIQPGQYTAQVRGKNETAGIGVAQVYFLQ